jgi:hypothetical protein
VLTAAAAIVIVLTAGGLAAAGVFSTSPTWCRPVVAVLTVPGHSVALEVAADNRVADRYHVPLLRQLGAHFAAEAADRKKVAELEYAGGYTAAGVADAYDVLTIHQETLAEADLRQIDAACRVNLTGRR